MAKRAATAAASKPEKFVVPKDMGKCADLAYTFRAQRYELLAQVKDHLEKEALIKDYIINNLSKSSTGHAGLIAKVSVTTKTKAIVAADNWPIVHAWIKSKKGTFDILQKSLLESAIKERWEAGEEIPGVEAMNVVGISVTKL